MNPDEWSKYICWELWWEQGFLSDKGILHIPGALETIYIFLWDM